MAGRTWAQRLGGTSRVIGLGGALLAAAGTSLARYDIIGKMPGFSALAVGLLAALIAIVIGIVALLLARRQPAPGVSRAALAGIVPAAVLLAIVLSIFVPGAKYPPLHDVSTDLADPPMFEDLELRADNLAGVGTVENWRAQHAKAFPDVRTLVIAMPVDKVIARAEQLARQRGWEIAHVDPEGGRLEATASVAWIRFRDDVVVRARPAAEGEGAEVDMRSVSRVGVGDLGENVKRVRAFMADLEAL